MKIAFSSLLLSLVGFFFEKIYKKMVKMVPNLNFENEANKLKSDINNYLNEINAKIINILNER